MGSLSVLDIVVIAIVLIFAISGFAKGFFASLLKLFSSVASLAVAIWLAKPVAVFINGIYDLSSWFATKISALITGIDTFFTYTVGVIPEGVAVPWTEGGALTGAELKTALAGTSIGDIVKTAINFLIKDEVILENGTVIANWFGGILGGIAMLIVAAVVIYIAIRIAIGILSKIFDAITKNPAIGGLDHLLGLVFGAAKGALVIAVIFAIYSIVVVIPGVEAATSSILESSTIAKPIYDIVAEFVATQIGTIDFNALIQGAFANVHL